MLVRPMRIHHLRNASLFAGWIAVVGAGLVSLLRYSSTPGELNGAPARWPTESRIVPSHERPTLLMVIHPWCPCSRASLGELTQIMAREGSHTRAYVLYPTPAGDPEGWGSSELVESAREVPGVEVVHDPDSIESNRFHALTSGYTVLYDSQGNLQFAGGITGSRGHLGPNEGSASITALIEGEPASTTTPVFGCPLSSSP
jgi:hypothetical protein